MTYPPTPPNEPTPGTNDGAAANPAAPQTPAPQYAAPQYAAPQYPTGSGLPGPGEPFDGAASPEDLTRPLYGATFGQAIRRFFKNYAKFSGRASRSEYWWLTLFLVLVMLVPWILYIIGAVMVGVTNSLDAAGGYGTEIDATGPGAAAGLGLIAIGGILLLVIALGTLVPSLALTWRRLHDANLPGPLFFLGLIPSVGTIVLIVLAILSPKPEGRRYDV